MQDDQGLFIILNSTFILMIYEVTAFFHNS